MEFAGNLRAALVDYGRQQTASCNFKLVAVEVSELKSDLEYIAVVRSQAIYSKFPLCLWGAVDSAGGKPSLRLSLYSAQDIGLTQKRRNMWVRDQGKGNIVRRDV
jgi:hypothetical protein